MHFLGLDGMPRRIPDYPDAFAYWNHIATMGYGVMGLGVIAFFINLFVSLAAGRKAGDNPWGEGATTLEWTLSSPPPYHQFETLPRISSCNGEYGRHPRQRRSENGRANM